MKLIEYTLAKKNLTSGRGVVLNLSKQIKYTNDKCVKFCKGKKLR